MKSKDLNLFIYVILMTVFAGLLSGQYVETTIPVSDSLSGIMRTHAIGYNEITNRIYLGGYGNYLMVIDCLTNQKIARIYYATYITNITCNHLRNKIYAGGDSGIAVIDGATNQVIKRIPMYCPSEILYNPNNDHIYAFNTVDGIVIDCQSDSVVKILGLWFSYGRRATLNPDENKIYCDNSNYWCAVIDCDTDSIINNIPGLGDNPLFFIYNNISNKVYYGDQDGLTIIDCSNDTIIAWFTLFSMKSAAFNPSTNKLYASYGNSIGVIDGDNNTMINCIDNPSANGIACDPGHNKIYCSYDRQAIAVYDGQSDSLIKTVRTGKSLDRLLYTPVANTVYGLDYDGSRVPVLSCANDSLIQTIIAGSWPMRLSFANNNKVYCGNLFSGDISVIDAETNQAIKTIDLSIDPPAPSDLVYNSANNKLYVSDRIYNRIFVIDCGGDSIIKTITSVAGPGALDYNPQNNKIYCAGDDRLAIIDGETDTIITALVYGGAVDLVYDSDDNYIYGSFNGYQGVSVFDGESNTVITEIPLPYPQPRNLAYNPVNNKVYITSDASHYMVIIDCNTNQIDTTVTVGVRSKLAYHSPNNMIYCSFPDGNRVTAVNGTTNAVEAIINIPNKPGEMISDPVFNRIYCAKTSTDSVAIIDGQTNTLSRTLKVGMQPIAFARNPYSNRTYVANYGGSSVSVIRDGAEVEETGPAAAMPLGLLLSPNPAQGLVKVRLAGIKDQTSARLTEVTLTLYDITGRSVKTVRIPVAVNPMTFDVSDLPAGVYFVGSDGGTKNGFQKLVITR